MKKYKHHLFIPDLDNFVYDPNEKIKAFYLFFLVFKV